MKGVQTSKSFLKQGCLNFTFIIWLSNNKSPFSTLNIAKVHLVGNWIQLPSSLQALFISCEAGSSKRFWSHFIHSPTPSIFIIWKSLCVVSFSPLLPFYRNTVERGQQRSQSLTNSGYLNSGQPLRWELSPTTYFDQ